MDELQALVDHVFGGEPKPTNSVQLQVGDDSDVYDPADLQKLLATITYLGANRLYGVEKCEDLTTGQYCVLQSYLRSMGFEMRAECVQDGATGGRNPWMTDGDFEDVRVTYELLR